MSCRFAMEGTGEGRKINKQQGENIEFKLFSVDSAFFRSFCPDQKNTVCYLEL